MVISWDEYFMGVAALSAKRSKDPKTQVGACIVNQDKRIIGIGYNGFPNGCSDILFPWSANKNLPEEWTKYPYVVHAEANAILNCTSSMKGATLYVTRFPCNECAKLIIQAGIKKVVYQDLVHEDRWDTICAKRMFAFAGVETVQADEKVEIEISIKR